MDWRQLVRHRSSAITRVVFGVLFAGLAIVNAGQGLWIVALFAVLSVANFALAAVRWSQPGDRAGSGR